MAYVLLDHWDAVELFCRIVSKYDSIPMADFQNNNVLMRKLKKYEGVKPSEDVSIKIFGLKEVTQRSGKEVNVKQVPRHPKAFYELGRMIRYSHPVVIDEDIFDQFSNFAKSKGYAPREKTLNEWRPSDKQRLLEGSRWWLYFYHQENEKDDVNKIKAVPGIAKSILRLNTFGKAEVVGYKGSECYTGKFSIYDREEKFLLLEMNLKGSKQKDLHILFYIGTSKQIDLALGQFHNLGRSIYSGTVMIEPIQTRNKKVEIPEFIKADKIKELPDYVQSYFKEKKKNILRVPCTITSVSDFREWHGGKNP